MKYLKIFSPATVANVSCGFDTLGFALDALGDEMTFTKTVEPKVVITKITGADLPYETDKNVAGAVVHKMLNDANADFGLEITIHKGFSPGSGLGSSAASGAGAAFGANQFLNERFSLVELVKYAMYGEEVACGSQIADNVSAALFGGFVLIRSYDPLEIKGIPVPSDLRVVALHPQIEVKTKDAREVLPDVVPLKDAISQWANVGGLIAGLYDNDYQLIANSLQDIIVEPHRKNLIPGFDETKTAALQSDALGAGISGSGPTIFALCKGNETQELVFNAMKKTYESVGIPFHIYKSAINKAGIKILEKT
ncbi:MAG: homoserine kinase [Flavobacteriaceae bacterium]|nr:homoserine kinase [Flavobacteriaceae bacterium]|tara:strand:+ start:45428 stop:46357 length:930 start_codon:yes stop_codon:yes gene_type:complete